MKQTIRLTESQFKKVITETIKRVLRENEDGQLRNTIVVDTDYANDVTFILQNNGIVQYNDYTLKAKTYLEFTNNNYYRKAANILMAVAKEEGIPSYAIEYYSQYEDEF